MKRSVRGAICRIDVERNGKRVSRGTGTLVAPGVVLTALHLVVDRSALSPALHPGPITLAFPGHKTLAHIHDQGLDADWVLLDCESPPPAIPVPLGRLSQSLGEWESHGFPDSNPAVGEFYAGTVEDFEAAVEGVAAFRLQSAEAVAIAGAPVTGLAGAPVIVSGWMVGHLRNATLGEDEAAVGMVYACPAAAVAARYPDLLSLGEVSHRRSVSPETRGRWWTRRGVLAALVLTGVVVILLRACLD